VCNEQASSGGTGTFSFSLKKDNKMSNSAITDIKWQSVCDEIDIPEDGGACVLLNGEQIAIFNFKRLGEWYATQNMCPHRQQMAISRGMIGSQGDEPKVACPFHKKTFSLRSGECLNDETCGELKTYPIKVEEGKVFIGI
jgi:nitrite reductase (NADH) small subunit